MTVTVRGPPAADVPGPGHGSRTPGRRHACPYVWTDGHASTSHPSARSSLSAHQCASTTDRTTRMRPPIRAAAVSLRHEGKSALIVMRTDNLHRGPADGPSAPGCSVHVPATRTLPRVDS
ncbi:hypothetical protein K438DRAFT_1971902 [Mycena galopus ATCC 62051]|nr:hypothetical protein K438DRAFT_1971902 [Mycena galopus ATCC 62051]